MLSLYLICTFNTKYFVLELGTFVLKTYNPDCLISISTGGTINLIINVFISIIPSVARDLKKSGKYGSGLSCHWTLFTT